MTIFFKFIIVNKLEVMCVYFPPILNNRVEIIQQNKYT